MNIAWALFGIVSFCLVARVDSASINEDYKRFDGHKVFRVVARTEEQLDVLRTMEEQSGKDVRFLSKDILFWTQVRVVNLPIDVMVSMDEEPEIVSIFQSFDITYETLIEDVQTLIDNENPDMGRSLLQRVDEVTSLNWTAYHRLDAIYNWLDELAETYPNWVEVVVVGISYEGRLVKGIKITFDDDNPGVFIEGGLHAREWISPATVTYLTNEILTSTNAAFNLLTRSHNWFIFPNRMWRKTRQPHENDCWGADANRNFAYYWLNGGASNDSCSETYAGPEPFSEPEIKALADYITSVSDKFYIYLSVHSYSQLILSPFAYTIERMDNYEDAMQIGNKAAMALAKRYGTQFVVGSAAEAIYINSGNSIDWVKGVHKTPVIYCYELRDTGTYGFLLPADQIIPTALEFIDSLIAVIGESRNLGYPAIHT